MLSLTGLLGAMGQDAKNQAGKEQAGREQAGKGKEATITKVDPKNGTVTVRMKDQSGKETEKTFTLTRDIRYFDSTGKAAAIDVFRSGDDILIIEAEGRLQEMHHGRVGNAGHNTGNATAGKGTTGQGTTGQGTTGQANNADQEFLKMAAQTDQAEIKLGQLAKDRAASAVIKNYGERMVNDHSKVDKELQDLAKSKGVTLPQTLDQKHQSLFDQLSQMKGADFDREYVKNMVSGHEHAIQQFEQEAKNGQDPGAKAFAAKWLPSLREHLELAKTAAQSVK